MIAPHHYEAIKALVKSESKRLGSQAALARKCGVNAAYLSTWLEKNPEAISDESWAKIAEGVGYAFDRRWQLVETSNSRLVTEVLSTSQANQMWLIVADKAGAGKSSTAALFRQKYKSQGVFYLECKEWSPKQFLLRLSQELALKVEPKATAMMLLESLTTTLQAKAAAGKKPIIIIDQANSLKPAALLLFIHIYNDLKGLVSVVLMGTGDLRKTIQRKVAGEVKGFDELERRFNRLYVTLPGCTKEDILAICAANGVTDARQQEIVWNRLEKRKVNADGIIKEVVADLGRVEIEVRKLQVTIIPKPNAA